MRDADEGLGVGRTFRPDVAEPVELKVVNVGGEVRAVVVIVFPVVVRCLGAESRQNAESAERVLPEVPAMSCVFLVLLLLLVFV